MFNVIKKIFSGLLGLLVGGGASFVVKWAVLLAGPYLLVAIGISGPEAAANLEAVASIVGLFVWIFVAVKIYKLLTNIKNKTK